jgi:hypothetical protein
MCGNPLQIVFDMIECSRMTDSLYQKLIHVQLSFSMNIREKFLKPLMLPLCIHLCMSCVKDLSS